MGAAESVEIPPEEHLVAPTVYQLRNGRWEVRPFPLIEIDDVDEDSIRERAVRPVSVHASCIVDLQCDVLAPSLRLSAVPEKGEHSFVLRCTVDCAQPCVLTVFPDCYEGTTQTLADDDERPGPCVLRHIETQDAVDTPLLSKTLPAELGQKLEFDLELKTGAVALVVTTSTDEEPVVQVSQLGSPEALPVQVVFRNGYRYVTHELYGADKVAYRDDKKLPEGEDPEAACIVCMTEQRRVALLPCRHLCLCPACADVMRRMQKHKCPLCREVVSSFLEIDADDGKQN